MIGSDPSERVKLPELLKKLKVKFKDYNKRIHFYKFVIKISIF